MLLTGNYVLLYDVQGYFLQSLLHSVPVDQAVAATDIDGSFEQFCALLRRIQFLVGVRDCRLKDFGFYFAHLRRPQIGCTASYFEAGLSRLQMDHVPKFHARSYMLRKIEEQSKWDMLEDFGLLNFILSTGDHLMDGLFLMSLVYGAEIDLQLLVNLLFHFMSIYSIQLNGIKSYLYIL